MRSKYLFRFLLLFIIHHLSFNISTAQWYDPDKVNKKAGEIYAAAYEEAVEGKYDAAIQHINEALVIDPQFVDAYLSRAGVYANLKNYTASVKDFEQGLQMDSVYSKTFLLPYSISLAGAGNFRKALETVTEFLKNPTLLFRFRCHKSVHFHQKVLFSIVQH